MPRLIAKFVSFVRWLWAAEQLPSDVAGADRLHVDADRPGFCRWLLHRDTLPQAGTSVGRTPGAFRSVFWHDALSSAAPDTIALRSQAPGFWRWVLCDEELPVATPADRDPSSRTMFFMRLLAPECCPEDSGRAIQHREGFLRRLSAPELCPSQPAQAAAVKKGWIRWLLGPEECPVDSMSAQARRRGFWRDLIASEKL